MDDKDLEDYFTFLRFQSVSSEAAYKPEVLACSKWLQTYLRNLGFDCEFWESEGHPVLFATHLKAGPSKPTLLFYNHYDVQPVDPLSEWTSQPFEPTIRNNQVYARGASDNKGQCFYVIQALKQLLQRDGSLPVNIKWCIEGEEECGSKSLSALIPQKKEQLKADYLAIVDCGLQSPSIPAVTLGMRGIITMDIKAVGSNGDLHSGSHGGVAFNPIHALIKILSTLRTPEGKIAVPGFYEGIKPLTAKEKSLISLHFDSNKYTEELGIHPTGGEIELAPLERNWFRPTIEINGIHGGYTGSGFKTVIPAKAIAKLSCRLVPDQDPMKIAQLLSDFLHSQTPEGIKLSVHVHPGFGRAVRTSSNSKVIQAFAKSYSEVFGKECQYIFGGGSIPIAAELVEGSDAEIVLLGLGLHTDEIHAPNEHFGLDRLQKGAKIIARALEILGQNGQ